MYLHGKSANLYTCLIAEISNVSLQCDFYHVDYVIKIVTLDY